jgi:nicotinate phosphoribosyltransferase
MNGHGGALLTDLYQLAMLQAYYRQGMQDTAVFEFFVRRMPASRNFLLAAGLEQALEYLQNLRFSPPELDWVGRSGFFDADFVDQLRDFRFSGDVHAMPEGSIFFVNEPILRVTAPLPEAQLVESRIINLLHFQTLIASKAVRCVLSAPDKLLVDFGMRRAHGAEAAVLASRANYLAGFSGTATVRGAQLFGIPAFGTMAHSFVEVHDDESAAFEAFALAQPRNVVLLIDTYDTERGAARVVELAPRLRKQGITVKAVRLDSGDLAQHACKVREILDQGGCAEIGIFCSGSLDEFAIRDLLQKASPIDGFGVGTRLDTSRDAPYLDCAYKLMEYAGIPRRKRSEGKATVPGRKQVYRQHDPSTATMIGDVLTVEGDEQPGDALLQAVMKGGQRLQAAESLEAIRQRVAAGLRRLPENLRDLSPADPYPVTVSPALEALTRPTDLRVGN